MPGHPNFGKFVAHLGFQGDDAPGVEEIPFPLVGGDIPVPDPVEELHPQTVFQATDKVAHGRLGDEHRLGGGADGLVLGQGHHIFHILVVQLGVVGRGHSHSSFHIMQFIYIKYKYYIFDLSKNQDYNEN